MKVRPPSKLQADFSADPKIKVVQKMKFIRPEEMKSAPNTVELSSDDFEITTKIMLSTQDAG